MANEADNNIVIECSPYGDSETEIMNLKNPSYEIISMPDIFEYEKSVSIFIYVISALGLLGFFYVVSKLQPDLSKLKPNFSISSERLTHLKNRFPKLNLNWLSSDSLHALHPSEIKKKLSEFTARMNKWDADEFTFLYDGLDDNNSRQKILSWFNNNSSFNRMEHIGDYIYYILLFLLFFIGIFVVVPHEEEQDFTAIYILFVMVNLVLFYRHYNDQNNINAHGSDYLTTIILRILFPSPLDPNEQNGVKAVAAFFALWIFLYILISLFRMTDNVDEAFSPIGLLSSYCFLKILDYAKTYFNYRPQSQETLYFTGATTNPALKRAEGVNTNFFDTNNIYDANQSPISNPLTERAASEANENT